MHRNADLISASFWLRFVLEYLTMTERRVVIAIDGSSFSERAFGCEYKISSNVVVSTTGVLVP